MKRIEKGEKVVAKVSDVRGLDPISAAGKVAREFAVDYGAISPKFSTVRDLVFPFLSFFVGNAKNWARYVARHPLEATVKFGTPMAAMYMWNVRNEESAKVEAGLPDWLRYVPHINTGYSDEDGKPIVIRFQTTDNLAARMVGLDRLPDKIRKIQDGELTVRDAVREQLQDSAGAPIKEAALLVNPVFRSYTEVLSNETVFGVPIVPERLVGTEFEGQLQREHVLSNIVSPYFQFRQVARTMEAPPEGIDPKTPLGRISRVLLEGPLDFERAVGIIHADLHAAGIARRFDAQREAKAFRESLLERLERAFMESKDMGDMAIFEREKSRVKAEGGAAILHDWFRRERSPRVRAQLIRRQINKEQDPERRALLLRQLQRIQEERESKARRLVPKSARPQLQQEMSTINPFEDA